MNNRLYYGDNLQVLREEIRNESVDLIYLVTKPLSLTLKRCRPISPAESTIFY